MIFRALVRAMGRIPSLLLTASTLLVFANPSAAGSRHVVIEFAGASGGVVTGAGDAWVLTTAPEDCDATALTPVPASCGLNLSAAPSAGGTSAAIKLGFVIKIGDTLYDSLYINRYGYVTFGAAPADGGFAFADSLTALQETVVDLSGTQLPFVAPFHANIVIPDNAFSAFAPFGGGSSYFRGTADPIAPFNVSERLPAFAVTWVDADHSISTQMVLYQKNGAGDFYLTLRYANSDDDPLYDISSISSLPAVAGFALTSTATDQVSLTGPLPGPDGYFYEFNNGHRITGTALALTCPSGAAQVGSAYTSALTASGGSSPYTYSIAAGSLPAGLTLSATTGTVTGTPTAGGNVGFTAQVADSTGVPAGTVTSSCSIAVNQAPGFTSAASASFSVGVFGSFTVTAKGFPAPMFSASGLPNGLTLSAAGVVSGTPAAGTAGSYNVTVTATNGVSPDATQTLKITVAAPSLTISPANLNFGSVLQYSLASKTVTLSNSGSAAVAISKVVVRPGANTRPIDFISINTCGSTLAAGKQCKIYVVLFAYDLGSLSATLEISTGASATPQAIPLSATVSKRRN